MQLASAARVVQSFGYGPRHLTLSSEVAKPVRRTETTLFTGKPNQPFVLGGQIHFTTAARSATVTFRNLFADWHCQRVAMVLRQGTLVHLCQEFTPEQVSGQETTCFLGPEMSYT